MTLLITLFAAIISTVVWYKNAPKSEMQTGILCWIYWGATLMWTVDAVFEYAELGSAFFEPEPAAVLNDTLLGLAAVALGLLIWLIVLLIRDPKGNLRAALFKKKKE
ncbi:MAG: hypothetical protein IJU20_03270 [Clostridia bacterium]|nr:hypothetical protein [Clostridia bacterium]